MKTFVRLLICLALSSMVLSSCSVTKPRRVYSTFIDYRPYTEANFFISPDHYAGKYESLGELRLEIYPAIIKDAASKSKDNNFSDGLYHGKLTTSSAYQEIIDTDEILELAVNKALELGANGLVNFKISVNHDITRYSSSVSNYVVSGLCIKILE